MVACREDAPVPWKIQLIDNPPAVTVEAIGPMKLALVKEVAVQALAEAASRDLHKFLVDDREMVPDLSTLELYQLPDVLGRMGLGKRDRAAVVYSERAPKAEDFRFFENTAINRGFDVRLFTDLNQAVDWLRSGG